jgi:hypothetical protein
VGRRGGTPHRVVQQGYHAICRRTVRSRSGVWPSWRPRSPRTEPAALGQTVARLRGDVPGTTLSRHQHSACRGHDTEACSTTEPTNNSGAIGRVQVPLSCGSESIGILCSQYRLHILSEIVLPTPQGGGHHIAEVKMEAVAMREYIAQS